MSRELLVDDLYDFKAFKEKLKGDRYREFWPRLTEVEWEEIYAYAMESVRREISYEMERYIDDTYQHAYDDAYRNAQEDAEEAHQRGWEDAMSNMRVHLSRIIDLCV